MFNQGPRKTLKICFINIFHWSLETKRRWAYVLFLNGFVNLPMVRDMQIWCADHIDVNILIGANTRFALKHLYTSFVICSAATPNFQEKDSKIG